MNELDYARKGLNRQQRPRLTLTQKLDRIGLIVVIVILSVIYGGLALMCLLFTIVGVDN